MPNYVKRKTQDIRKYNMISKICYELDVLYKYAEELIPKDITHDLGYKKELEKKLIEDLILQL